MPINFTTPEDLLCDESFLSWYFKTGKSGEFAEKTEADKWDNWMSGHPDRVLLVEQAVALLQTVRRPEKTVPASQLAAAESALFKKMGELPENKPGEMPEDRAAIRKPIVPLYRRRSRWAVAAVLLAAVVGIGLLLSKIPDSRPERRTAYGQLSHEQLPDGTLVMMNANSRLSYSTDWKDGADREVWMAGEAFFCVKKTPQKSRFIVHTDHFDIIVTGTQFNVVNRSGIENVLLEEGSVTLRTAEGKELNMKPGEFVAFRDAKLEKKPVQHDSLVAWKEQKLVFDKTPLRQLVRIINDQYGVDMKLENESIGDSTISGIMPDNNLDVFIKSLEGTSDFDVIKEGDHFIIRAHSR